MRKRTVILLIFMALLAFAVISSVARANSANALFIPSGKATAMALQTMDQATINAMPTVMKTPAVMALPTDEVSCPEPTRSNPGIIYSLLNNPIVNFPFSGGGNLNTETIAKSSVGNYYWMWAGAPDDERGEPTPKSRQGLIRVIVIFGNPCVSHALGTQEPPLTDYLAPKGPLTFTKVVGDTVLYSIAGGGSGRFNFVTGKFLP